MAQAYGRRPSDFFDDFQEDEWIAFQFDKAVFLYGESVDVRYEERDSKYKRRHKSVAEIIREDMGELPTGTLSNIFEASGLDDWAV